MPPQNIGENLANIAIVDNQKRLDIAVHGKPGQPDQAFDGIFIDRDAVDEHQVLDVDQAIIVRSAIHCRKNDIGNELRFAIDDPTDRHLDHGAFIKMMKRDGAGQPTPGEGYPQLVHLHRRPVLSLSTEGGRSGNAGPKGQPSLLRFCYRRVLGRLARQIALAGPDEVTCDNNEYPEHDQCRHMVAARRGRRFGGRRCRIDLIILRRRHGNPV